MATEGGTPRREATPPGWTTHSSLPQKRAIEDDHSPAVSSPLNPEVKPTKVQVQVPEEAPGMSREKRAKKESLKKRESKGAVGWADGPRDVADPKHHRGILPSEVSPHRYISVPKPSHFEPARGPVFTSHHDVPGPDGTTIEFMETSDQYVTSTTKIKGEYTDRSSVYNKRNFKYTPCIADPAFPSSIYYRRTEPEPYDAHVSFEDAATHMFFDKSGKHITTDKGFRMARANVAVREGRWYWECKITRGTLKKREPGDPESHGHVRVGWARREASLDAPVGFDAYSYGIRDVAGQKVHMSRPKDFFPPGEDLREGDVIGLEIQLPSEQLHRKVVQGQYNPAVDFMDDVAPTTEAPNIVRDRMAIRFKTHLYFENIDYSTTKELDDLMNPTPMGSSGPTNPAEAPNPNHPVPCLRTLPNSHIKVYKNGVLMGTAFTNLLAFLPLASKPLIQTGPKDQNGAREGLDDGMLGYYPAVSVFRGGAAEVNFGPNFWYPPPGFDAEREDVEMTEADGPVIRVHDSSSVGKIRAVCERYDEQIVEDVVYDVIDEVDFWMQDGGVIIDRFGKDQKAETAGMAPGREEIKELVQDD
jgi:COMPASS component BRE2